MPVGEAMIEHSIGAPLKKLVLVDARCELCGHVFEEFIREDGEIVLCPSCSQRTPACLSGLGIHCHNRHAPGGSWGNPLK